MRGIRSKFLSKHILAVSSACFLLVMFCETAANSSNAQSSENVTWKSYWQGVITSTSNSSATNASRLALGQPDRSGSVCATLDDISCKGEVSPDGLTLKCVDPSPAVNDFLTLTGRISRSEYSGDWVSRVKMSGEEKERGHFRFEFQKAIPDYTCTP